MTIYVYPRTASGRDVIGAGRVWKQYQSLNTALRFQRRHLAPGPYNAYCYAGTERVYGPGFQFRTFTITGTQTASEAA